MTFMKWTLHFVVFQPILQNWKGHMCSAISIDNKYCHLFNNFSLLSRVIQSGDNVLDTKGKFIALHSLQIPYYIYHNYRVDNIDPLYFERNCDRNTFNI